MPYHGYPLGYQGFYPQGFQPYSNPFSDRSNNGENKPPSVAPASTLDARDESASEDAIARLEKLILDERLERETKEAARLAAIAAAAAEKAAHENQIAHDRKIAEEAAALTMAAAESRLARLEEALKASEVKAAQETPKQRDLCIVQ